MRDPWRRLWTFLARASAGLQSFSVRHRRALLVSLAVVLGEVGYIYIASTGLWTSFPFMEARIDELAEAFRAGHLHLLREPPLELLQRANPFDTSNARLWYWDASLYGRHYYFYWGPVPALLLAAVKTVLRISRRLGDYVPLLGLVTLQLVFGALLIERLARRLFPRISAAGVAGAVLVFAFATPTPFILGRPAIYEGAIVGGEAFLILGLLLAFDAIWHVDRPRRAVVDGAGAGVAFGLAVGCRASMAPGIVVLCLAAAGAAAWRSPQRRFRRFVELVAAQAVPLAILGGLLLLYNRLRFDHWLEFGQRYQLSWIPWKWSTEFIPANLYSYALRPGKQLCRFPFLRALTDPGPSAFPRNFHFASGYFTYEPLIGQLRISPWIWLCPVAFVSWRAAAGAELERDRRLLAAVVLLAGSLPFLPALCAPSATMRYLGDFSPVLMVLGCLGAWNLQRLAGRHPLPRWTARALVTLIGLLTMARGFSLGFTGYYNNFEVNNPALSARLERAFSICRHE